MAYFVLAESLDRLDQLGLYLIGLGCFFGVLAVLLSAFWGWMLLDCAMNESPEGNDKAIWLVLIFFLHFGGAMMYYGYRRPRRKKELGR